MADEGPSCEELVLMSHAAAKKLTGCYDYEGYPQGGYKDGLPQDTCEIRRKYCMEESKKQFSSRP
jgi:hypothetical protein